MINFTSHPNEHNMTYCQHFFRSLGLSSELCLGGVKAFIHAWLPFLFETSSTDLAICLRDELLGEEQSEPIEREMRIVINDI
jgi:hypothetical protein